MAARGREKLSNVPDGSELDRTRRRGYPSYLGIGIRSARHTLKIEMRHRLSGFTST